MKIEISAASAKMWSRFGSRAVYGQAILALADHCPNLIAMSADLGNSSGLDRFKSAHPDKFVNVGIAEQNLIGFAAGIAKEGFVVFASSFAPFIAMRASEQIRMNLGYMQLNVKAVGIGSGLSMGFLGNSHYGIEDLSVMRSIPGMSVVAPADCAEIFKVVFAASQHKGPMYIRLTGGTGNPPVYLSDYQYEIGKAVSLKEGEEILFIACGSMVYEATQAAVILESNGISCGVMNMHTVKPIDKKSLVAAFSKYKLIVSVEEHSITGGLGSAIAEMKADIQQAPPLIMLGLPDKFGKTGSPQYLLEKYELVGELIANRALNEFKARFSH